LTITFSLIKPTVTFTELYIAVAVIIVLVITLVVFLVRRRK